MSEWSIAIDGPYPYMFATPVDPLDLFSFGLIITDTELRVDENHGMGFEAIYDDDECEAESFCIANFL